VKTTPITMISVTFELPSATSAVTAMTISGSASTASTTRLIVSSTIPRK
jgi:hypothetical protein